MIGKRGKLLIVLYMVFLLVLFLMCSTDLIIREPEQEIYQLAVIIEDVRDDNYSNFRKGMEQAAVEFNADVRFITLYEKLDAAQQMELIEREQQDGTDALIVAPVDADKLSGAMMQKQITIPMVLLGSELTGEKIAGTVRADYSKMGAELAHRILKHIPEDGQVLIFSEQGDSSIISRCFLEGAMEALDGSGYPYQRVVWNREQGDEAIRETLRALAGTKAVILAESPEILTKAAGIMAEEPSLTDCIQGLYGRGSTLPILNYLDRGLITGVCVTDDFSMGYLSVCMAIQKLERTDIRTPVIMDFYYIEKKNLREPAYEKMLFPIE